MTTKLTQDEKQVLNDYINYWMNEYNLDQLDMLSCTVNLKFLEKKLTKEQMLKNPRLLTNMVVVAYVLDKEDDSEEED